MGDHSCQLWSFASVTDWGWMGSFVLEVTGCDSVYMEEGGCLSMGRNICSIHIERRASLGFLGCLYLLRCTLIFLQHKLTFLGWLMSLPFVFSSSLPSLEEERGDILSFKRWRGSHGSLHLHLSELKLGFLLSFLSHNIFLINTSFLIFPENKVWCDLFPKGAHAFRF